MAPSNLLLTATALLLSTVYVLSSIPPTLYIGLRNGKMMRCETIKDLFFCTELINVHRPIQSIDVAGPKLYVGLENGDLLRCLADQTDACTTLNNTRSSVDALVLDRAAGMVHLGLRNGFIVTCHSDDAYETYSCGTTNRVKHGVNSLAISGDKLFAGLRNGLIQRCSMNMTDHCVDFHKASHEVKSLAISTGYIYAGLHNGDIIKCRVENGYSCSTFNNNKRSINALDIYGGTIYAGLQTGELVRCDVNDAYSCSPVVNFGNEIRSLRTFMNVCEFVCPEMPTVALKPTDELPLNHTAQ